MLKKKYLEAGGSGGGGTSPPTMTGFFASTLQKTKHNLSKFSNRAFNQHRGGDKEASSSSSIHLGKAHYANSSSTHNLNSTFATSFQSLSATNITSSSHSNLMAKAATKMVIS